LLLSTGKADVNAKDKEGTNSLMAAAARGHLECIKSLLDANADVNEQNVDGHTALMFAFNGKNQVETLWERYSQFITDAKLEKDQKAIEGGDGECAEGDESCSAAASDEDIDDGGTGPLIKEALASHTELVNLLTAAGADASLKDKEGHVASDFDFQPDADGDVLEREEIAAMTRDNSKNEL